MLGSEAPIGTSVGIGKIERLPLRHVWPHEALDFTTWLEHNTDVLSEALGFTIANVERERAAGSFSVDLVGEDAAGNPVVIENQLERSDHDHLRKADHVSRRVRSEDGSNSEFADSQINSSGAISIVPPPARNADY